MSLIKNDIPILEYDTNSKAVIMPGHSTNFHFPERAVMLFMETEIDDYAMTNKCEIIGQVIATGCCGALVADNEGDFYIPTSALRQEGTSYHYLPPSREVMLNQSAINAIEKILINHKYNYQKCKTWTTDGFYRETKEMVEYRKEEGFSVVEMECASLAACAEFRNIVFGQLLFTADSLANIESHDTRNWGNNTFALAMNLAMDAVTEVQ